MQKTADTISTIGTAAARTIGAASATVLGFAAAGVAASSMGQILHFQLERLSRTVAGLFGPELRRVTELIGRFTDWLDHLSNSQKKMIAFLTLGAAGLTVFLKLLPGVIAGISGMITAVLGLAGAINAALDATGIGALLPLIGYAIGGITAAILAASAATAGWLAFTDDGADLLRELADTVMPLVTESWELLADIFAIVADVAKTVLIPVLKGIVFVLKEIVHWLREALEGFRQMLGIQHRANNENRNAAPAQIGGFEGIRDTWSRIAQSSRLVGQPKEKKPKQEVILVDVEQVALGALKGIIPNVKPLFGA
jgi:hypothetical protein